MSTHVTSVSPSLRVQTLHVGGQAHNALLLAVRWNDESEGTEALVITEHGGIEWIPHDRVAAGQL